MKHLFVLCLLAVMMFAGSELPAQPLAATSTSGSAGQGRSTVIMAKTGTTPGVQESFAGSYISRTGDGYWQKLTIKNNADDGFNIAISFGGATRGCTFKGEGVYNNGRIDVDLNKVNSELKATMTITLNKDTAKVFTTNYDDRLKLMWFCGGGASLAGSYKKEKIQGNNLSWYKVFSGKVDRYPVTMHLHKWGHNYAGYYYYDQQQRPIYFSGEDSSTRGKLKLTGFGEPGANEEFVLSVAGEQLSGSWKKNENAKPLVFTAAGWQPSVDFSYIFSSGVLPLRASIKTPDAPAASFHAAAVWPVGETARDIFLKKIIRNAFAKRNNGSEEIGALFLAGKKDFFAAYQKEHLNVKDIEIKEMPATYQADESKNLMVAHATAKLLTLALNSYTYTGGVHGNYGTSYLCIDLVNNKQLLLDDVINSEGIKVLGGLLEKSFRQQYHLKPTESLIDGGLLEKSIKPNKNFYLTQSGILFNYMPYEIGPYALGEINLFVPLSQIEKYLQPTVRNLLQ